jgi:hypothetical protein
MSHAASAIAPAFLIEAYRKNSLSQTIFSVLQLDVPKG